MNNVLKLKIINSECEIYPAFESEKAVVCVFELSEQYIKYFDVFLHSFLNVISNECLYDIIILSNDIDEKKIEIINNLIKKYKNISIRFFNPDFIVSKYITENKNQYLYLSYYRLALPWILHNYDKVINLGVDMIVMKDLQELFETVLDENIYIAGARDFDYIGRLNIDISKSELCLIHPENYINADVLIYNLKAIRENYSMETIMAVWEKYPLRLAEQDVINVEFEQHCLLLDGKWNVFPHGMLSEYRIKKAPMKFQIEWKNNLKDPYIIHFAGTPKPWNIPSVFYGDLWWQFAKKSDFYIELIFELASYNRNYKTPILKKTINYFFPINSHRGKIVRDIVPRGSKQWIRLRNIYLIFTRNPDAKKYGKTIERKIK